MNDNTPSLISLGMFSGATQHDNFCRLPQILPSRPMRASSSPVEWPEGDPVALPQTYEHEGALRDAERFFTGTDTAALLLLQDGAVRHERYALTGARERPWISWSVAKSFVSALVGIAIEEGHLPGVDAPISDWIRVEPGSAYDGVSIRHVLQMSSGARWNEDYNDPASDVHRLGAAMAGALTLDDFVAGMVRDCPPGQVCRYNSGDTQALGALLVRATGRPVADYMQEKLVEPLGMEVPGAWLVDSAGMEMAFAGLNLTARDFARIGELYRNGGRWKGRQVVPEAWARASVTPDAPHLEPGQPILADHRFDLGYGYQWWIPDGERGEFSAIGIYNQFVYVDPSRRAVIVKLSANRAYGTSMDDSTNRDLETVSYLRAVAASLD